MCFVVVSRRLEHLPRRITAPRHTATHPGLTGGGRACQRHQPSFTARVDVSQCTCEADSVTASTKFIAFVPWTVHAHLGTRYQRWPVPDGYRDTGDSICQGMIQQLP